jgi:hypothetical protein
MTATTMKNELPTPEQQEATARRFRGQRALVNPEVVQEPSCQPPAPTMAGEPSRSFSRVLLHWARWTTFWILIGLNVAAIGAHQVNSYSMAHASTLALVWAAGILVGFWCLVGVAYYLRLVWRVTDEALKPIPSLAEIDQRLRAEGYAPTIADVVAIEQDLRGQRNASLLAFGALVIGPQLLAREAEGGVTR